MDSRVDYTDGPDYEGVETSLVPAYNTTLSQFEERHVEPLHVQALGITEGESYESIVKKLSMLTSYVGVQSTSLRDYVNMIIKIRGVCIYHVDYFTSKETGRREPGYDIVLLKLDDTVFDKGTNQHRHIIAHTHGKLVFDLVRNIIVPYIGWFDFPDGKFIQARVTQGSNGSHVLQVVV